jgi:heptosyltransferase-3
MDLTAKRKIVIYRLGSLGDTIVALPCFHRIAQATPQAERIVLTNFPVSSKAAPLEGILGGSGLISRTIDYPVGERTIGGLWALIKRLKALQADTMIYLTPQRGLLAAWRDVVFFRLCGFKLIVGAPLSPDLQNSRLSGKTPLDVEPECERLARCLVSLGPIDLHDRRLWDLRFTESEREVAAQVMEPLAGVPYLAINLGGKDPSKDWGLDNWLALLGQLRDVLPGYGLLVVGAPEDSARAPHLQSKWGGPFVDACGRLSPRQSAAAMSGARLFIGHDSGPMHLAAAVGVPCIGLYGANGQPGKWRPYGASHRVIYRAQGMQAILVDEVMAQARDIVNNPAA